LIFPPATRLLPLAIRSPGLRQGLNYAIMSIQAKDQSQWISDWTVPLNVSIAGLTARSARSVGARQATLNPFISYGYFW